MYFLISVCVSSLFLLPIVVSNVRHKYPEKQTPHTKFRSFFNNDTDYILPTNIKPTWYQLFVSPEFSNNTFSGTVNITFDVVEPTKNITLHVDGNIITLLNGTTVVSAVNNPIVTGFVLDSDHQFVHFQLNDSLMTQKDAQINIAFNGRLSNDMLGFYLSTYKTATTNHSLAVTQFEPNYARRAFPCFDEPKYRAKFTIRILRPSNMTSMSNMGLNFTEIHIGLCLDVYNTTPSMPTYLVAFGVSDLSVLTNSSKNLRVFARESVLRDGTYALSVGHQILDTIGEFLDIEYPLEKMDIAAIPDFNAGAMENWGLTTFREKYVIYNQSLNTVNDKFRVLTVIAHEFGHQWFGDLVTPEWWDYAWLNEAFATYIELTFYNKLEPSWDIGSAPYVMWAVQEALARDVNKMRPMTHPVFNTSQIEATFDYVIYLKGGSILRMAENFLNSSAWRNGLNKYLIENAYQTGTPDKLFSSLQSQSSEVKNVTETLTGWTTQGGYPLITVVSSNLPANVSGPVVFNITQRPYASNGSYVWNVPLRYTTQSLQQFNATLAPLHWLMPSDSNTSRITINETGWVIFNVDQVGFYRVNYDENNWLKLKAQLKTNLSAIGSINRAQILDDAFHLGRTGHLDFHKVIGITHYLPLETELAPWNAFIINMRFLINQFQDSFTGGALKKYALSIVSDPFKALLNSSTVNAPSTLSAAGTLQSLASFGCEIGLPSCEKLALSEFQRWRTTANYMILPEMKQAVLCTALRKNFNVSDFQSIWNYFLKSDNAAEQLTLINVMGCATNTSAILQLLDQVCDTNSNYIRLQDRWIVFRELSSNQATISAVLDYLKNNFNKASQALGPDISEVMTALGNHISFMASNQYDQVKQLASDVTVNKTLQNMITNIVLPAVEKRQNWIASEPANSLMMWANCYMGSAAESTFRSYLRIPVLAVTLSLFYLH